MNQSTDVYRKVVTVSFLASGVVFGITTHVLLTTAAAVTTGPVGRVLVSDYVIHGLPVAIGILAAIGLSSSAVIRAWAFDVVAELGKVVWPSVSDTRRMTVVVGILVILAGLSFGVLDVASGKLVEWLLTWDLVGLFS